MNKGLQEIKIVRVITEKISTPTNDGSPGSGLYSIPFELNLTPSYEWSNFFVQTWNSPPEFTSMHRPGIASVSGKEIWLRGTTLEEVEGTHKKTLELSVKEANRKYESFVLESEKIRLLKEKKEEEHQKNIEEKGRNIKFD